MNYKERFDNIIKKIGDRGRIEGIDSVFKGSSGYISVGAKGLELSRNGDRLRELEFKTKGIITEIGWDFLENVSEGIKDWFSYVESKVDNSIPSTSERNLGKEKVEIKINNNKIMRQLTPQIIQNFTEEEKNLYLANLLDEDKVWTETAKALAIDIILQERKVKMGILAKELIKQERESMLGGLIQKGLKKE